MTSTFSICLYICLSRYVSIYREPAARLQSGGAGKRAVSNFRVADTEARGPAAIIVTTIFVTTITIIIIIIITTIIITLLLLLV